MIKRPTRLSAQVFLDLPPVLGHYLENTSTSWIETSPPSGKVSFMGRVGVFEDVESMAVERRQILQMMGRDRARLKGIPRSRCAGSRWDGSGEARQRAKAGIAARRT